MGQTNLTIKPHIKKSKIEIKRMLQSNCELTCSDCPLNMTTNASKEDKIFKIGRKFNKPIILIPPLMNQTLKLFSIVRETSAFNLRKEYQKNQLNSNKQNVCRNEEVKCGRLLQNREKGRDFNYFRTQIRKLFFTQRLIFSINPLNYLMQKII